MRLLNRVRPTWMVVLGLLAFLFLGGWSQARAATATEASETSKAPDTPDAAFYQALDLERQRDWSGAIDLYERALELWPSRSDFRHRLRLCESHYRLNRRYQDRSFRESLLALPREDVLALYQEVIERIDSYYVEPVAMTGLLRQGYDNLEVALRDETFQKAHGLTNQADRVKWLREAFSSQRARVSARTPKEARAWVEAACDLGRQALDLPASAIALEFAYGACDVLDDYSGCLTPDKVSELYAEIDGNFVGLGVELKLGDHGLRLVGVIPGGPAWESGLKAGEQITHVDDEPLQGLGLDEAAGRLQGEEGTSVKIRLRNPEGQSRQLELVRRPVEVKSVTKVEMLEGGVGYLRLTGFQKTTTEEVGQAIKALESRGMRHLILDLRGNPGGLLNVAVDLAERFIDRGLIVATRGRAPGQTFDYSAHSKNIWRMPLTVLIDRDSASASEILAGALKDHRRAVIVGQQSYGKGSVQSIYPLRSADAALKLTTARFYSPRNRPYHEQGVAPDLEVRTAARPTGHEAVDYDPSAGLGDPATDSVLDQALRQARHQ
ncbi:S41 family peptidase [soil metagenome]